MAKRTDELVANDWFGLPNDSKFVYVSQKDLGSFEYS